MTTRNKDEAPTFAHLRKCILAESKNAIDPRQSKIISDASAIKILRISKKNRDVFKSIEALYAYTFKIIKTKDGEEIIRAYKAKDIMAACALYQQSECIPAFLESIALERRTEALKIAADAIIREEENIKILTETLTDLGENSKVYEVYLKKIEAAQYSLTNKVKLLKHAKNMQAFY